MVLSHVAVSYSMSRVPSVEGWVQARTCVVREFSFAGLLVGSLKHDRDGAYNDRNTTLRLLLSVFT